MHYTQRILVAALFFAVAAKADEKVEKPAPPAVPRGEIKRGTFNQSKVFPGTTRDYSVYVPKQYDGSKPACLYVGQDGGGFGAPATFDRLIAEGKMPVTIGVFVNHG